MPPDGVFCSTSPSSHFSVVVERVGRMKEWMYACGMSSARAIGLS